MKTKQCPLCKREVPELLYDMHVATDMIAIEKMKRDFPGWSEKDGVCEPCLKRYKEKVA
ncbi:MAG: hypothetical protein HZC51_09820 [Nitrospirae bacterium]|nr:hypothetical protein [Nitrospirota bacterium]